MKLIDTHCHLNADPLFTSWQSVVGDAINSGVAHFFVVGWDEASSRRAVDLALKHPAIKAIIGLHPVEVNANAELDWIESLYRAHSEVILAIGEIGLDYYWKKEEKDRQLQKDFLIRQIDLANRLHLPIVIHCREAHEAILPIFEGHPIKQGGVMHCYAGASQLVSRFIQLGFYLSFGGPITYKNAQDSRENIKLTPLNRLLIETDSPYLSPHPFRGKTNSPFNLPIIFRTLAQTINQSAEILEKNLFENTLKAFHVKTL